MSLSTIRIGELEITRLVIGGNPFSGNSHRSAEASKEMRDYYTTERIKATLRQCERCGINTLVGRGDNHIMRMLNEYWNEGGKIQWIAQTAPERSSIEDNIRQIAAFGAKACYLHGGMMDNLFAQGKIESMRKPLTLIEELGMLPGLAAHNPEVHLYAEEHQLGAKFYMVSFYNLSKRGEVYLPEDRDLAARAIQEIQKPCIAYKVMAAGRNDAEEAFNYAFSSIKPTDAVCVGVFTKYHPTQVEDNVKIVERILTG